MNYRCRPKRCLINRLYRQILLALIFQIACVFQAFAKPNLRFEHLFENIPGGTQQLGPLTFILRDHNGMMWFAGEKVYRYDGVDLHNYTPQRQAPCADVIRGMVEDQSGVLWIVTGRGLCSFDPDHGVFKPFQLSSLSQFALNPAASINVNARNEIYIGLHSQLAIINPQRDGIRFYDSPLKEQFSRGRNEFRYIFFAGEDEVWIGSRESGLIRFSPNTGEFIHFLNTSENPTLLPSNDIRSITQDRVGNLWFASHEGGLSRLNPERKNFKHYFDKEDRKGITRYVWHLLVDSNGQLWIGTDGGGLLGYDDKTDAFFSYRHDPSDKDSIASNKAIYLFEDNDKNIWVNLYPSGIELVDRRRTPVQSYRHNASDASGLNADGILSILGGEENKIWVGTELGLNLFDPATQTFENYSQPAATHWHISTKQITAIKKTLEGNLWIGTWGDGLYFVDTHSQAVTHYEMRKSDPSTVDIANILDILPGEKETWIAGEGEKGILIFDHQQKQFKREVFKNNVTAINSVQSYAFLLDSRGQRWIATLGGLYGVDTQNKLTLYSWPHPQDNKKIPSFRIRSLFEDSKGRVWIGSQDQGVFIYEAQTQEFHHLELARELPSSNITRIMESKDGSIWLFTANGLVKVSADLSGLSVFNDAHGLLSSNLHRGAGFIANNDIIYAGGVGGLSVFNADSIDPGTSNFSVRITGLKLFNQDAEVGKKDSPLVRGILNSKKIHLNYQQNIFTLSFAALSYPLASWNEYAYKLGNFESDWNYVGNKTTATYTNIPAGHYVFQVKAKNSSGKWSDAVDSIEVDITPPPWKTLWAYSVYVLVLAFVVRLAIFFKTRQLEQQKERAINKEILRLNLERDEMRRNFIADISHELKTPISILAGELEAIEDGIRPLSLTSLSSLGVEVRNLNKLVDDLFDLSLADVAKLKFTFQYVSLVNVVAQALYNVEQKYFAKDIKVTKLMPSDPLMLNIDPLRIHQLFLNLFENAFRYTDAPGQILLKVVDAADAIVIEISDSKPGVPEHHLDNLFIRFYREEPSRNRASGGTGLGLSICRYIAEAHQALITATNSSIGGLCITIKFPKVGDNGRAI